jgi:hypothetical protein
MDAVGGAVPGKTDISLFQFEFLGNVGGYNGKFYKHLVEGSSVRTGGAYVSGMANKNELSRIFFNEYSYQFPREDFFQRRIGDIANDELQTFLRQPKFYTADQVRTEMKKLKFTPEKINEYMIGMTTRMLGTYYKPADEGQYDALLKSNNTTRINECFHNAQSMYFLGIGDSKAELTLKKKIFLTIFGIITKTGYITFLKKDKLQAVFREKLEEITKGIPQQTVIAEFRGAPYVVLGSMF